MGVDRSRFKNAVGASSPHNFSHIFYVKQCTLRPRSTIFQKRGSVDTADLAFESALASIKNSVWVRAFINITKHNKVLSIPWLV